MRRVFICSGLVHTRSRTRQGHPSVQQVSGRGAPFTPRAASLSHNSAMPTVHPRSPAPLHSIISGLHKDPVSILVPHSKVHIPILTCKVQTQGYAISGHLSPLFYGVGFHVAPLTQTTMSMMPPRVVQSSGFAFQVRISITIL